MLSLTLQRPFSGGSLTIMFIVERPAEQEVFFPTPTPVSMHRVMLSSIWKLRRAGLMVKKSEVMENSFCTSPAGNTDWQPVLMWAGMRGTGPALTAASSAWPASILPPTCKVHTYS